MCNSNHKGDGLRNEYEIDIIDRNIPENTTYEDYIKMLIKDNDIDAFSIEEIEVE